MYRYFRDDLGLRHIQLIPIVERDNDTGFQEGDTVTDRSVEPEAWGRFLTAVFDEWVVRDVGDVFVQMFDAALASWLGPPVDRCASSGRPAATPSPSSTTATCTPVTTSSSPPTCSATSTDTPMVELVASPQQVAFGRAKADTLPRVLPGLRGPLRLQRRVPQEPLHPAPPTARPGLNYLCAGYKAFFTHIDGPHAPDGRPAARRAASRTRSWRVLSAAPRNEPCPCGSGRKAKHCHGR